MESVKKNPGLRTPQISKEIDVPTKYIGVIESGTTPVLFQHFENGCALDRCNGLQVQKNLVIG